MTVDRILEKYNYGKADIISMTINGAELEAVKGMKNTFKQNSQLRLSIAGWYRRDGVRICDLIYPILKEYGFHVFLGRKGGVLAWL